MNEAAVKHSKWFKNAKEGKYGKVTKKGLLGKLEGIAKKMKKGGLKAIGPFGKVAEATSILADEKRAKEYRDILTLQYKVRGYSEAQINELIELRIKAEARGAMTVPIFGIPNQNYDEKMEKYLNEIPKDVIVPEKDVDKLKHYLTTETEDGGMT